MFVGRCSSSFRGSFPEGPGRAPASAASRMPGLGLGAAWRSPDALSDTGIGHPGPCGPAGGSCRGRAHLERVRVGRSECEVERLLGNALESRSSFCSPWSRKALPRQTESAPAAPAAPQEAQQAMPKLFMGRNSDWARLQPLLHQLRRLDCPAKLQPYRFVWLSLVLTL